MLLDILILGLCMPGLGLVLMQYLFKDMPGIVGELPWGFVGAIMFGLAIGIIKYRGRVSTAWKALDFPTPGLKLGVSLQGASLTFESLQPSIAGFLNANNTGRYYKDDPDGSYGGLGGHEIRLIDREVGYCLNPEKAILIDGLSKDGFYDWEAVEEAIKKKMVTLVHNGSYLLTGTTEPPNILDVDIVRNPAHKELFDYLAKDYFVKTHGRTYSLKNYHRFQERQAAPIQIGIIIYYAKALAAMRAAKVKKGMGGGIWILVGIVAVIVILLVLAYLFLSGKIAF